MNDSTLNALHEAFLIVSAVPVNSSHRSGSLDDARGMMQAHATLADHSIYAAAVCGNAAGVQRWIEHDPALASARGGASHQTHPVFLPTITIAGKGQDG